MAYSRMRPATWPGPIRAATATASAGGQADALQQRQHVDRDGRGDEPAQREERAQQHARRGAAAWVVGGRMRRRPAAAGAARAAPAARPSAGSPAASGRRRPAAGRASPVMPISAAPRVQNTVLAKPATRVMPVMLGPASLPSRPPTVAKAASYRPIDMPTPMMVQPRYQTARPWLSASTAWPAAMTTMLASRAPRPP